MTKLDGDARGGAALSIKELTGKPVKFLGMGETLDKLEEFRPEGLASRILGFGDVVGLMQDFERVVDEKKAEEDAMRMLKGAFTLTDFLEQLQSIKKMGSLSDLVEKIPGFSQLSKGASVDDRELVRVESIINSMTAKERQQPGTFLMKAASPALPKEAAAPAQCPRSYEALQHDARYDEKNRRRRHC